MIIEITYWDYSTWHPCDICNNKPDKDWSLATIDGKRHCMYCLGNLVTYGKAVVKEI